MEQKSPAHRESLWSLLKQFFIMGCCAFGGGWAIVAQIQKEYVEKRKVIQPEDLLDMTSVGRSIPGLMIGNVAYLFGFRVAGFWGGMVCLIGITVPAVLTLTVVTWCYSQVAHNPYVMHGMAGVRAAVVPIVFSAALKLRKAALVSTMSYVIFGCAAILYIVFHVDCIVLVLMGILMGALHGIALKKVNGNGTD